MTFEKAVAEALAAQLRVYSLGAISNLQMGEGAPHRDDAWLSETLCASIGVALAPRVAAAIHSLALDYARMVESEWGADDPAEIQARCARYEAEALADLRGDAP